MLRNGTTFLLALHELNIDTESYLWYYNININNRKGRDLKMQLRVWGTPEENNEVLNLLHQELKDKIKIVSAPYPSSNNKTQRIYIEVDLQNRNYRKTPLIIFRLVTIRRCAVTRRPPLREKNQSLVKRYFLRIS